MKISNLILGLFLAGLALFLTVSIASSKVHADSSDITLSGKPQTHTYEAFALKHIDIEGPIKVMLSAGIPQMSVSADQAILDELKDRDPGQETVSIKLPNNLRNVGEIILTVQTPTLESITLTGEAQVQATDSLPYSTNVINLNGSGSANLLYKGATRLDVHASGGTKVTLAGYANTLSAELSGGNSIEAGSLLAQVVDVKGSGSTHATVAADSLLTFSGSGSSHLEYYGSPKVNFSGAGSSSMKAL